MITMTGTFESGGNFPIALGKQLQGGYHIVGEQSEMVSPSLTPYCEVNKTVVSVTVGSPSEKGEYKLTASDNLSLASWTKIGYNKEEVDYLSVGINLLKPVYDVLTTQAYPTVTPPIEGERYIVGIDAIHSTWSSLDYYTELGELIIGGVNKNDVIEYRTIPVLGLKWVRTYDASDSSTSALVWNGNSRNWYPSRGFMARTSNDWFVFGLILTLSFGDGFSETAGNVNLVLESNKGIGLTVDGLKIDFDNLAVWDGASGSSEQVYIMVDDQAIEGEGLVKMTVENFKVLIGTVVGTGGQGKEEEVVYAGEPLNPFIISLSQTPKGAVFIDIVGVSFILSSIGVLDNNILTLNLTSAVLTFELEVGDIISIKYIY